MKTLSSDFRRKVIALLAKEERGALNGQELVNWASEALVDGHETQALVTLAGLDLDSTPLVSDAMPLFRSALGQLGISVPSGPGDILRLHYREIATQLCNGEISASQGVSRIEREVVTPLGHPKDLMEWCFLSSDLHPETLGDLRGAKWERYVLELAAKAQQ